MKGSPVKLGVIIAAAIVGIVTLATAFNVGTPTAATSSPSASPTHTKSPKPAKVSPDSQIEGLQVGVYNGTSTKGLAARAANEVQRLGASPAQVGDATSTFTVTTVYYAKPSSKDSALALATHFSGSKVEAEPSGLEIIDSQTGTTGPPSKTAEVLLMVGSDYNP